MEFNLFPELYFSYKQGDHPFLDMYHLNRHSTHTRGYSELRGFIYSINGRHSHPFAMLPKKGTQVTSVRNKSNLH
jgi:hypothetical protein